jgi:hypothetical protein
MKWKDANRIQDAIQSIRLSTLPVQNNRAKINTQFDGGTPWTEEERRANKIFTNANWLEGSRIAHNARLQYNNAFVKPGAFFKAYYDRGPVYKRVEWSEKVTKNWNKLLKKTPSFKSLFEANSAQVVLHGIGPSYWNDRYNPIPKSLAIEDVQVAAGTLCDRSNLGFFAIYREWTYPELYKMTHGPQVDPGWNQEAVSKILKSLNEASLQPIWAGNRWLQPEKMEADWKENSGWFLSSSAPKVFCWDFYFEDDEELEDEQLTWQRRIVLDCYQTQGADTLDDGDKNQFLYDSSKKDGVCAYDSSEILHLQYGNCSNVAPFRHYSVKGVGYLLYMVCMWQDRLRCRMNDAIFESLLTYFKNVSEDDRERLESINLMHMGVMPDGVSIVPPGERTQVNDGLLLLGLSQNRQLMQESSSSYLSPQQTGEMGNTTPATATEELIKVNASAALTSAMLNGAYESIVPFGNEVFRRFCIPESKHPLVQKFRAMLVADGVPLEILNDPEAWDITPNRVLGGGNSVMETIQANALMGARPLYDPPAQRMILKLFTMANSNADFAEALVPEQQPVSSSTTVIADLAMGTLMDALQFTPPTDINIIEYVNRLMQQVASVAQQLPAVAQAPNSAMALAEKIAGIQTVIQHITPFIQQIAQQGDAGKQQAKLYEDALKEIAQAVMPFMKMLEEQAGQQGSEGIPPEVQQKLMIQQAEAQQKMQIDAAKAGQKMEHKDRSFMAELERRNAQKAVDLQEQQVQVAADIAEKDLQAQAQILNEAKKTDAQVQMNRAKEESKPKEKPQPK